MGKKVQIHDMNQPLTRAEIEAFELLGVDEGMGMNECDDMFPDDAEATVPPAASASSGKPSLEALRRQWIQSREDLARDGLLFELEDEPGDNEILRWSIQAEFIARDRKEAQARTKELSEKRRHWRLELESGWNEATQEDVERGINLFMEIFTPDGAGGKASAQHFEAQRADQKGLVSLVRKAAVLGVQVESAKVGASRASMLATCLEYSTLDLCSPLVQEGLVNWQAWPRGAKAFGGAAIEEAARAFIQELVLRQRGEKSTTSAQHQEVEDKLATLALFCESNKAIRARVAEGLQAEVDELARRAWEIAPTWSSWQEIGLSRAKTVATKLEFALGAAEAKACGDKLAMAVKTAQRKIDEAVAWSSACQCALNIDSNSLLETLLGSPALLCEEARAAQPNKSAPIGPEGLMVRALKADARLCVEALASRGEWGVKPSEAGLRPVPALAGLAAAATDGSDDERAAWGKQELGNALGIFAKGALDAGHGREEVSQWLDGILTGAISGKKGQALCKAQACILELMLEVQINVGIAQPSAAPTRGGMRL